MSLFLDVREILENIGKDGSSNMNFQFEKIIMTFNYIHTDAPDCYGPPKMLILVFIKFRENQE